MQSETLPDRRPADKVHHRDDGERIDQVPPLDCCRLACLQFPRNDGNTQTGGTAPRRRRNPGRLTGHRRRPAVEEGPPERRELAPGPGRLLKVLRVRSARTRRGDPPPCRPAPSGHGRGRGRGAPKIGGHRRRVRPEAGGRPASDPTPPGPPTRRPGRSWAPSSGSRRRRREHILAAARQAVETLLHCTRHNNRGLGPASGLPLNTRPIRGIGGNPTVPVCSVVVATGPATIWVARRLPRRPSAHVHGPVAVYRHSNPPTLAGLAELRVIRAAEPQHRGETHEPGSSLDATSAVAGSFPAGRLSRRWRRSPIGQLRNRLAVGLSSS